MTYIHKSHIEEYLGKWTYCNQSVINMYFTFIAVLVMAKLDKDDLSDSRLCLLMAVKVGVRKMKFVVQQTELS